MIIALVRNLALQFQCIYNAMYLDIRILYLMISANTDLVKCFSFRKFLLNRINTKASDEAIYKISVILGVWSPGKSYRFLKDFEKALLENLICSYCIIFLQGNRMCFCRILRKFSWKFWCALVHFASPGKFWCVFLYHFWFSQLASWKIWCVLEISLKKSVPENRTDILAK